MLTTVFPEPTWVIPDRLAVGLTVLVGKPKTGKSFLALQLAVGAAAGDFFLDAKIREPLRVIYLALEDQLAVVSAARPPFPAVRVPQRVVYRALEGHLRRLQGRPKDMNPPYLGDRLRIYTEWPSFHEGEPGLEKLRREIESFHPHIVIIDTLAKAYTLRGVDWNQTGQIMPLISPLQDMAQDYGLALLIIDHHDKAVGRGYEPSPIDDLIGSISKAGAADCVWGLYRPAQARKADFVIIGRDQEDTRLDLIFAYPAWHVATETEAIQEDDEYQDILDLTRELGEVSAPPGKSRPPVCISRVTGEKTHGLQIGELGEEATGHVTLSGLTFCVR